MEDLNAHELAIIFGAIEHDIVQLVPKEKQTKEEHMEKELKQYSASRFVIGKDSISYLDSNKKFLVIKNGETKQLETFKGAWNYLTKKEEENEQQH